MRDDPWTAASRDKEQQKVTMQPRRKPTVETAKDLHSHRFLPYALVVIARNRNYEPTSLWRTRGCRRALRKCVSSDSASIDSLASQSPGTINAKMSWPRTMAVSCGTV